MRCDQLMGMTPEATAFLRENEVPENKCACCNRPFPRVLKQIGSFVGMFEARYPLFRHILKDGKRADEFLQAQPWSSGPCFFIGLRIVDGIGYAFEEFLWEQIDIAGA